MSSPTLSVVMPNYNHARFLPEALEAILAQSYQPLEIIVIDDASTDNSLEILEAFARKNPSIRIIRGKTNIGGAAVLQHHRGVETARGDYWYGAAADDKVLPGFFEKSMRLLAQYPEASFCSALTAFVTDQGDRLEVVVFNPLQGSRPRFLKPDEVRSVLLRHGPWFQGNSAIYRRRLLLDVGGFPPALKSYADGFIQQALALRHGVCFISETLAARRWMEENYSTSTAASPQAAMAVYDAALNLMQTTYADLFPEDYVNRWKKRWIYSCSMTFVGKMERDWKRGLRLLLRNGGRPSLAARLGCAILGAAARVMRMALLLSLRMGDICPRLAARAKRTLGLKRQSGWF